MVSSTLIKWYRKHQRPLPWRETTDAYIIWLSEIILQQTRVEQGTPYFFRFLEKYPDIQSLARAPEDEVLKLWQGLGYYSRARNLREAAGTVVERYQGKFPDNFDSIRSLKGIGDYTAAAIASFAFGLPHPVIDGNVYRFLSRYFGIDCPVDSSEGKKIFKEVALKIMDKNNPAEHNQAIMEFGALQCTPLHPTCQRCPFSNTCYAHKNDRVAFLPVKGKKTKIRNRFFNYLVLKGNEYIFLRQRPESDIWRNLYDFPLIETDISVEPDELFSTRQWIELVGNSRYHVNSVSQQSLHKLSHQHLFMRFYELDLKGEFKGNFNDRLLKIRLEQAGNYPVPKPVANYLEEKFGEYITN
jgi:A/G-specific adenine glycosylase